MVESQKIRLYQYFRLLILFLYIGLYLALPFLPIKGNINLGFFVIMSFPVFTPFLYSFIFSEHAGFHLNLYLASISIFLTISLTASPELGFIFFLVALASLLISLFVVYGFPKQEESEISGYTSPNSSAFEEGPPTTKEEKILNKISEIDLKIEQYQVQLDGLYRASRRRHQYLSDVEQRLTYEHLNEENRRVTKALKESLEATLENYKLLIEFFSEAKGLFDKEKINLEATLGNLEIINFLQKDSPLERVAEIEKTMLQMEFEKHIKEIESELPILKNNMLADSIDLSQDMKLQLEEAIRKLK